MAKNVVRKTRTVLLTGGSRGLGLAIAKNLMAAGYDVIAVARKSSKALEAAMAQADRRTGRRGKEKHGAEGRARRGSLRFVAFDFAETDKIPELVRGLREDFGPLYALVNNAALGVDGLLATMHNSHIEAMVRVNTLAPLLLSKYVVRAMMAGHGGRIVNVASIVGFTGYSGLAAYAATKAAMLGFTRALAREVGRLEITVNAVAPGFLDTDMTHGLGHEQRQKVVRRSALRRLASVEDVAHAVAFLLSDKARGISGTVLTVDAGATA